MIDLHSHILPGIDDGASDLSVALEMARIAVADGVQVQACTPHILPGLYNNTGPQIRVATQEFQQRLDEHGIPLRLVTGADAHLVPDFVGGLKSGRILSLADTRYVLVEPPHHVAPPRLEEFFFELLVAGYTPVLTHPERLTWIEAYYPIMVRLFEAGVLMQITAGSLTGSFGKRALYWGERMLDERRVHLLASDAHSVGRRRPNLSEGRRAAEKWVGSAEAEHLVLTRPRQMLANESPSQLPAIAADDAIANTSGSASSLSGRNRRTKRENHDNYASGGRKDRGSGLAGGLSGWMRSFFR